MRIENWSIGTPASDPYTPPEMQVTSLSGTVYGHPRFDDGVNITTSAIVALKGGRIVTRSGSEYELGQPHPEYEAAYPNAKQRALALIPITKERRNRAAKAVSAGK